MSDANPTRITAQAAAEILGVSRNTLYEYAKQKTIPAKKIGRNWIFIREELLAWLVEKPES